MVHTYSSLGECLHGDTYAHDIRKVDRMLSHHLCTKRKCTRFHAIIQTILQSYTNKEKWLFIQQFQVVPNLSALVTDIRFSVIGSEAFCRAKWD